MCNWFLFIHSYATSNFACRRLLTYPAKLAIFRVYRDSIGMEKSCWKPIDLLGVLYIYQSVIC